MGNAFAALLWQHMQRRQLASARRLSKAVKDFYTAEGEPLLANLSAQTIQHWIGTASQANRMADEDSATTGQRTGQPQHASDILRVAAALRLNRAQTTRLLWAAGKPSADALLALPAPEFARLLRPWQRVAPNNLPHPLTSYIGRDEETVALAELLSDPTIRLVTLTGPGGCGKTRLALEVARYLLDTATDGVYFVSLETEQEPQEAVAALLAALGLPRGEVATRYQRLVDHLRGRRILLVIDNMEQLLAVAPKLAELLEQTVRVQILATSRTPLGVYGEYERAVLPLPPPEKSRSLTRLRENPAAMLFTARAQAVAPQFVLSRDNGDAVRRLCILLEGLPLAIELTAARVRDYPPGELLRRYKRALDLAVAGPSNRLERQQSLRQTIDWSYRLLSPEEQHLFRRLAVFRGGWPREAIGPVCADGAPTDALLSARLDALVGHSLVTATSGDGGDRYRLLEPIREYAAERLREHESLLITGQRHAEWCIALGESLLYPLQGGEVGAAWLATIEREYANIQIALERLEKRDPAQALRLAAAIWPYWFIRQDLEDGRRRLGSLLERVPDPSFWRGRALRGLGLLNFWHDLPAAHKYLSAALAFAQEANDRDLLIGVGWAFSLVTLSLGRPGETRTQLSTWWPLANHTDYPGLRCVYLMIQGYLAEQEGRFADSERDLGEALADATVADQPLFACMIVARQLSQAVMRGDFERARDFLTLLQSLADRIDSAFYRQLVWNRQGMLSEQLGDLRAAEEAYQSCLRFAEQGGRSPFEHASSHLGLGRIALLGGRTREAHAALQTAARIAAQLQNQRLVGEVTLPLVIALWDSDQGMEALQRLSAVLANWEADSKPPWLVAWIEVAAILALESGHTAGSAWLAAADRAREGAWPNRPRYIQQRLGAARQRALATPIAAGQPGTLEDAQAQAQGWLAMMLASEPGNDSAVESRRDGTIPS